MAAAFAGLLRRHRRSGGLTQEALAERALLSVEAVSALERGTRRFPRPETVKLLADALRLSGEDLTEFLAAVPTRRSGSRGGQHRPPQPQPRSGPGSRPSSARWREREPAAASWHHESAAVPRELPPTGFDFTGRKSELATLVGWLREAGGGRDRSPASVVTVIAGMGGVGKTALAVRAGHLVAEHFPDGQLYVDLGGNSPGAPMSAGTVLRLLLRALGVRTDELPADVQEVARRYRTALANRRTLIVLENVADTTQIAPLLPGAPGCATVVTSRWVLQSLSGARHLRLGVLTDADARDLLAAVVGPDRVAADPDAAHEVVRRCGRLPLAIRLVGARLASRPDWPLSYLVDLLASEERRLDALDYHDISVRASFGVSIQSLADSPAPVDRRAAELFDLIGLLEGPDFGVPVAARLLDLDQWDTGWVVERLVDAHLVDASRPERYRMHDLLRAYATERVAATVGGADQDAVFSRLLTLYAAVAWRCNRLMRSVRLPWADSPGIAGPGVAGSGVAGDGAPVFGEGSEALDWLDRERQQMVAAIREAARRPGVPRAVVLRAAVGLGGYCNFRHRWRELTQIAGVALEVAQATSDRMAEGLALTDLGVAAVELGWAEEAFGRLRAAVETFQALPNPRLEVEVRCVLSYASVKSGVLDEGISCAEQGLRMSRDLGDPRLVGLSSLTLGNLYGHAGDLRRALACHRESLKLYEQCGHGRDHALALLNIGIAQRDAGLVEQSVAHLQDSVQRHRGVGDAVGEAEAWDELAAAHLSAGRHERALECLRNGLVLATGHHDRFREASIRLRMGAALNRQGHSGAAAAAWELARKIFQELGDTAAVERVAVLLDASVTR